MHSINSLSDLELESEMKEDVDRPTDGNNKLYAGNTCSRKKARRRWTWFALKARSKNGTSYMLTIHGVSVIPFLARALLK